LPTYSFYIGNSALDVKKKVETRGKDDKKDKDRAQDKYNNDDDDDDDDVVGEHYPLSSYAHNRYSVNQSPSNNYRTRSRGPTYSSPPPEPSPSSYDDYTDSNDWSRTRYER
jgi:hypothetical protein